MKKWISIAAALLILTSASLGPITVLPIGSALPESGRKMKDIGGKEISMAEAAGENGLLVMFSCNTCPYVIKNEKRIHEICTYARQHKIGVILLNSNEAYRSGEDSYDEMKKYAAEQKYQWNYVVDNNHQVADAFGANRTPESFLFDKFLTLIYHGAIDDNPSDEDAVTRRHLKEAINEMLAGKEISIKESRSVGCTIKRLKTQM